MYWIEEYVKLVELKENHCAFKRKKLLNADNFKFPSSSAFSYSSSPKSDGMSYIDSKDIFSVSKTTSCTYESLEYFEIEFNIEK